MISVSTRFHWQMFMSTKSDFQVVYYLNKLPFPIKILNFGLIQTLFGYIFYEAKPNIHLRPQNDIFVDNTNIALDRFPSRLAPIIHDKAFLFVDLTSSF